MAQGIERDAVLSDLIKEVCEAVIAHEAELTALDSAIGDGDHGLNMKRGFSELLAKSDELAGQEVGAALKAAGMTLVMKVGGASGPLYGSLFMSLGKELAGKTEIDQSVIAEALAVAQAAVMARGKSQPGQKTMLDVIAPVQQKLAEGAALTDVAAAALAAAEATAPIQALKGRASFLGERSIGHVDPGARSSAVITEAACRVLERSG
ncbi:MAG: dihydroxyacetone kinase subunit DhaL [Alphaproteobacteria bacterium]|nr:dihydroxyacetone kinase subunit DhaL [Alphaproteobacteria bacterium]